MTPTANTPANTPATSKPPGRSPCGCSKTSSSSGKSGCSCGCGGSCASCSPGRYERPNFFSGQLLTEDDLQQLVRYVVDKNRLHNRYLFGSGVVCGLEVTCDPCGSGTVTVNPGYALDCCGNDVVVTCPAQLDINDLYRKLRASVLGTDCGDPCSDPTGKGRTTKQEVCLYIKYCESEADPVAPYSTGDNCGATQCQPTRIQEGYSFELRCRTSMEKPNTMLNRIANCIGEPAKAEVVGRDSLSLDRIMKPASRAIEEIRSGAPLTFTQDHATAMATHAQNLQNVLTSHAQGNTPWTSDTFLTAIDELRSTAGLVTRYYATRTQAAQLGNILGADPTVAAAGHAPDVTIGEAAAGAAPPPPPGLDAALSAIKIGVATLQPLIATTVPTALDQAASQSVIDLTNKWANESTTPAKVTESLEGQYFARNVAFTPALLTVTRGSLVNQQTWLLARTDCTQPSTDCSYSDELHRIQPSAPPSQKILEPIGELSRMYYEYSVLSGSLIRYLRQCGCAAVNPPCPPCDDMGVLLACLEMENCKVARVCNLERTFVLTPVAARYWLPLSEYGDEIEELCCPIPRGAKTVVGREQPMLSAASPVMRSIDALFGGGSLTNFAEAVTTSPLDALRMRNALQSFRNKVAPAAGYADTILTQAFQNTQAATVNDRIDAVRADTMAQLELAMSEIRQLRQDLSKSRKKAKPGVTP